MTSTKQAKEALRKVVILTNGNDIHIQEMEVTPLEMCEICRRIIKRLER